MPFEKGQSGNKAGKPKGTISQKTKFWNEVKEWFMGEGAEKYIKEMKTLKGRQYTEAYSSALEYFQPKLSRVENKVEAEKTITIVRKVIHGAGNNIS